MITKLATLGRIFVVDEDGVRRYGLGASVDFSKFTDPKYNVQGGQVIPGGTIVSVDPTTGMFIPPASGDNGVLVLAADAYSQFYQGGDYGMVGAFVSANLYENFLPDADATGKLPDTLRTQLLAEHRFQLQTHPDFFRPFGETLLETVQATGAQTDVVIPGK